MCKVREYGERLGLVYDGDFGSVLDGGIFLRRVDDVAYGVQVDCITDTSRADVEVFVKPFYMDAGNITDEYALIRQVYHAGADMMQPAFWFTPEPCGRLLVDRGIEYEYYGDGDDDVVYGPLHGPLGPVSDYWSQPHYGIERYWIMPVDSEDEDQLLALIKPLLDEVARI